MDLKKLDQKTLKKGIADKGWNIHLPNPLKPQETVWVHPDQAGIDPKHYIRIIHSDPQVTSVFSKRYFE
jgi:hypothetical protein